MSEENVEIVRQLYDATARRDADTVLSLYDPEVEIDASRYPAKAFIGGSGIYHGHEGLRALMRYWHDAWGGIEYDVKEIIDRGDCVISVTTARVHGRGSGAEVESALVAVWTIREDRIVRSVWFGSREEALEAAGLSE